MCQEITDKKRVQIPKISADPEDLGEKVFSNSIYISQEQKDNLYNLLSGFHGYSRLDVLLYLLVAVCHERFTIEDAADWLWVSKKRLVHYYKKFGFMKTIKKKRTNSIWMNENTESNND